MTTATQTATPVADFRARLGLTADSYIKPWTPGDSTVACFWGPGGTGKTTLAFSAATPTRPIVLFDLEHNTREAARRFDPSLIIPADPNGYWVPILGQKEQARPVADRLLKDYHQWLRRLSDAGVRATIVIDSVTKLWELMRYAFVPLNPDGSVKSAWAYGEVNQKYEAFLAEPRRWGHDLILTCRSDAVWREQTSESGKVQRVKTTDQEADWKDPETAYQTSIIVEMRLDRGWDEKARKAYQYRKAVVRKCTPNGNLVGYETQPGDDPLNWETLMQLVEAY
jgi:hypothetical protein